MLRESANEPRLWSPSKEKPVHSKSFPFSFPVPLKEKPVPSLHHHENSPKLSPPPPEAARSRRRRRRRRRRLAVYSASFCRPWAMAKWPCFEATSAVSARSAKLPEEAPSDKAPRSVVTTCPGGGGPQVSVICIYNIIIIYIYICVFVFVYLFIYTVYLYTYVQMYAFANCQQYWLQIIVAGALWAQELSQPVHMLLKSKTGRCALEQNMQLAARVPKKQMWHSPGLLI